MFVISIVFFLLALALVGLLTTSKSVIWTFRENGNPSSIPSFVIFNPFREKRSEAKAEEFLTLLKNQKCEEAITGSPGISLNTQDMCERERQNRLEDWELSYRKDGDGKVELFYRVKRVPSESYSSEMCIELKKETDTWKVTCLESIY